MSQNASTLRRIGLWTAGGVAVANMVGTGVFTSVGLQLQQLSSPWAILLLWLLGGIIALLGAVSYAELSSALPRSGGEYHLLARIYHPSLGFVSGLVSLTAGFAAPTAIAALALGKYLAVEYPAIPQLHVAAGTVVLFGLIHARSVWLGTALQNLFTTLKLLLMVAFVLAGLVLLPAEPGAVLADWGSLLVPGDNAMLLGGAFAIAFVYVSYSYTGWNAAVYIAGEIERPERNLTRALVGATLTVMLLYVALNAAFLRQVPGAALTGQIEVGSLAAQYMFGAGWSRFFTILIALLMLSTISAMVFIGGRIVQVMGEDYALLRPFSRWSRYHTPVRALGLQTAVTLLFIYSATFEQILVYAASTLILMTSLTVAGLFVLRLREPHLPRPYRAWGYPVTPLLFLLANSWILAFVVWERPWESLLGLGSIALGAGAHLLVGPPASAATSNPPS